MGKNFPGNVRFLVLVGVSIILMVGCAAPEVTEGLINVGISVDGDEFSVDIPAGSTVDNALRAGGVLLGSLDRTDPPLYTVLGQGSQIRVVRVEEDFSVEQEVIPFESQVVRNESLPEGQEYWLQLGENGLREITIRRLFEDGEEVSSNPVKSVMIKEPIPQIRMVGVQKAFAPFEIPGVLAYLVDGDAWVMEGSTGNRRQLITSGDLDGRIFTLSPDGEWLLFTRSSEEEDTINTLWSVPLDNEAGGEVDLGVSNIVHFADWKPDSGLTIAYSTVEPRPGAPGWQANNDLQLLSFSSSGFVRQLDPLLETNSGGLYGWWGTEFHWSPDGLSIAYARPDEIGIIDPEGESDILQTPLKQFTPVQTFADWAWVPGISWGPEGDILYGVDHAQPEGSQIFDLEVFQMERRNNFVIASEVGMFAYPVPSPQQTLRIGENAHLVAFLQAAFPMQSETSRYNLVTMDRDGSNKKILFPSEGAEGLEPQKLVWSPESLEKSGDPAIAFIYQDNLWIVDSVTGEAWQITGDNLTSRIDWK
jgi:hypothetical protein